MADGLRTGQLVELNDARHATIRFLGTTSFAPGTWIGVEFADASGKNDGSVQGQRYFDCPMGHGMFLRESGVASILEDAPPPTARQPPPTTRSPPAQQQTQTQTPTAVRRQSSFAPGSKVGGPSTPAAGANGRVSGIGPGGVGARKPSETAARRPSVPTGRTSPQKRPSSISNAPPRTRASMTAPATKRLSTGPVSATGTATAVTGGSRAGRTSMMGPPGAARAASGSTATSTSGASARPSIGGNRTGLSPTKATSPTLTRAARPPSTGSGISATAASTRTANGAEVGAPSAGGAGASSALQKQNSELETRLRVLEKQRAEDRERLKTLDKVQQERDKFESIIQKLQSKYQPQQQELVQLRKQLKESENSLEQIEAIQAEHDSTMEMATLDREMAEEMAEGMRTELEALRAKAEELQLENEILRDENTELGVDMSPEERTSKGWLQLERENERLREALLRLRDMSLEQEAELKNQVNSLEEDVQELGTVRQEYTTTKERLLECEADIEDLKQQLEAALGAEEMIEELTEKNMALGSTVEDLKATVDDFQSLKELNDELEINHIENEKQLQEVIDYKDMVISEQLRRSAQREETVSDQEYTIARFRELVTNLQSDLEDMRASKEITETEAQALSSRSRTMMDLNRQLAASATNTKVKTIEMELRKLDAQEASEHLEIVQLFLPEAFRAERDSVLALLRFRRIGFKATLVHGFVRERVAGVADGSVNARMDDEDVFGACDVLDKLTWVSAMSARFTRAISSSSLEEFTKFESALYELEPVERALNSYIEALKKDDLHERHVVSELQRSIAVMTHLAENRLDNTIEAYADDLIMRSQVMQSNLDDIAAALSIVSSSVQSTLPPSAEDPEDQVALFANRMDETISQSRSAKVIIGKTLHGLQELRTRSLALRPDGSDEPFASSLEVTESLATLTRSAGAAAWALLHDEGRSEPLLFSDISTAITRATSAHFSALGTTETTPFSALSTHLTTLTSQLSSLQAITTDLTQAEEFESPPPPWQLRSAALAASKLVSADAEDELRRAREAANQHAMDLSRHRTQIEEQTVKIQLLESRTRDAAKKSARIAELEKSAEEIRVAESQLREQLKSQAQDLHALEADRDKWRRQAASAASLRDTDPEDADPDADDRTAEPVPNGQIADESKTLRRAALSRKTTAAAAGSLAAVTDRELQALRTEIAVLQSANRFMRRSAARTSHHYQQKQQQSTATWLDIPLKAAPSAVRSGATKDANEGEADKPGEMTQAAAAWAMLEEIAALPAAVKPISLSAPSPSSSPSAEPDAATSTASGVKMTPKDEDTERRDADGDGVGRRGRGKGRLAWRPRKETPQFQVAVLEEADVWALDGVRVPARGPERLGLGGLRMVRV